MSDTQDLVRERRGPLLLLRLARPEARNALTPGLLSGIGAAVHEAESDPEVRALVLTGTGDRSFCAGMDLRAFAAGEQIGVGDDDATRTYFRLIDGEVSVPLVGAANGSALAGGLELLLACDVIVASTAAEFGLPEVKRGLFPAGNGAFLGSRIPLGVALEMALTGDPISAARAHELGLVNVLAPPESVLDAALAVAERIAANGPLGLAAARELVRLGVSDATRVRARRDEWQQIVFRSEDAKEGALAFVEKRPPVWRGR
ncbi:MAG TPA: enoyl-CoA hydratase-related protein [Acidimicrobiia bacterium]|nr:enoyl-CoA hydratase-related protein [Acidimicrobiia bacterium]